MGCPGVPAGVLLPGAGPGVKPWSESHSRYRDTTRTGPKPRPRRYGLPDGSGSYRGATSRGQRRSSRSCWIAMEAEAPRHAGTGRAHCRELGLGTVDLSDAPLLAPRNEPLAVPLVLPGMLNVPCSVDPLPTCPPMSLLTPRTELGASGPPLLAVHLVVRIPVSTCHCRSSRPVHCAVWAWSVVAGQRPRACPRRSPW